MAEEVKALLTLERTLSEPALLCTALIDLFAAAWTFTDHLLITFPLPSISAFPPFPAIPYGCPATPDGLAAHRVDPDLAWALPQEINDATQAENDALINSQPTCSSAQVQTSRDAVPAERCCNGGGRNQNKNGAVCFLCGCNHLKILHLPLRLPEK